MTLRHSTSRPSETAAAYFAEKRQEFEAEDKALMDERIRDNFELDKIVKLGTKCKQFLESDVGRFIVDTAAQHAEEAKDKIVMLSRSHVGNEHFIAQVEELQQEARVPNLVLTWILNAIQAANQETSTRENSEEMTHDY